MRQLRERIGLSQEELSGRCGIPLRTYQRWESGESVARPNIPQIKALCRALRISIEELPDVFGPLSREQSASYRLTVQIPTDADIAIERLTQYVLPRSPLLQSSGLTPEQIQSALRSLIAETEAQEIGSSAYGVFYEVAGTLRGQNREVAIVTIWMHRYAEDRFQFVTLKPTPLPTPSLDL